MKKWLSDIFTKFIENLLTYLIFGSGLTLTIVFFKRIVSFLNYKVNVLCDLLFVIFLIGIFIGYELAKPKKIKRDFYFEDYSDVSWKVTDSPRFGIRVDTEPYCKKCKIKYLLSIDYDKVNLLCPNPECIDSKQYYRTALNNIHQAVKNIAEAKLKGHNK